jgi:hypothetical protein
MNFGSLQAVFISSVNSILYKEISMRSSHSSKLAALLHLCFSAGMVAFSGAAIADCNLDHTICTQPGPVHGVPSFCDLYPDNIACAGGTGPGWGDGGNAGEDWVSTVHQPNNPVVASCASIEGIRRASVAFDIAAVWGQAQPSWFNGNPEQGKYYQLFLDDYWGADHYSTGAEYWYMSNYPLDATSTLEGSGPMGPLYITKSIRGCYF